MCIPSPRQMTLAAIPPARGRAAAGQIGDFKKMTSLTQRAAHRNTPVALHPIGVGAEFCLIISD
jgi:hypothetical protein